MAAKPSGLAAALDALIEIADERALTEADLSRVRRAQEEPEQERLEQERRAAASFNPVRVAHLAARVFTTDRAQSLLPVWNPPAPAVAISRNGLDRQEAMLAAGFRHDPAYGEACPPSETRGERGGRRATPWAGRGQLPPRPAGKGLAPPGDAGAFSLSLAAGEKRSARSTVTVHVLEALRLTATDLRGQEDAFRLTDILAVQYSVLPGYLRAPGNAMSLPVPPFDCQPAVLLLITLLSLARPASAGVSSFLLCPRVCDMVECLFWLTHCLIFRPRSSEIPAQALLSDWAWRRRRAVEEGDLEAFVATEMGGGAERTEWTQQAQQAQRAPRAANRGEGEASPLPGACGAGELTEGPSERSPEGPGLRFSLDFSVVSENEGVSGAPGISEPDGARVHVSVPPADLGEAADQPKNPGSGQTRELGQLSGEHNQAPVASATPSTPTAPTAPTTRPGKAELAELAERTEKAEKNFSALCAALRKIPSHLDAVGEDLGAADYLRNRIADDFAVLERSWAGARSDAKDSCVELLPYVIASAVLRGFHRCFPAYTHVFSPKFATALYQNVIAATTGVVPYPDLLAETRSALFAKEDSSAVDVAQHLPAASPLLGVEGDSLINRDAMSGPGPLSTNRGTARVLTGLGEKRSTEEETVHFVAGRYADFYREIGPECFGLASSAASPSALQPANPARAATQTAGEKAASRVAALKPIEQDFALFLEAIGDEAAEYSVSRAVLRNSKTAYSAAQSSPARFGRAGAVGMPGRVGGAGSPAIGASPSWRQWGSSRLPRSPTGLAPSQPSPEIMLPVRPPDGYEVPRGEGLPALSSYGSVGASAEVGALLETEQCENIGILLTGANGGGASVPGGSASLGGPGNHGGGNLSVTRALEREGERVLRYRPARSTVRDLGNVEKILGGRSVRDVLKEDVAARQEAGQRSEDIAGSPGPAKRGLGEPVVEGDSQSEARAYEMFLPLGVSRLEEIDESIFAFNKKAGARRDALGQDDPRSHKDDGARAARQRLARRGELDSLQLSAASAASAASVASATPQASASFAMVGKANLANAAKVASRASLASVASVTSIASAASIAGRDGAAESSGAAVAGRTAERLEGSEGGLSGLGGLGDSGRGGGNRGDRGSLASASGAASPAIPGTPESPGSLGSPGSRLQASNFHLREPLDEDFAEAPGAAVSIEGGGEGGAGHRRGRSPADSADSAGPVDSASPTARGIPGGQRAKAGRGGRAPLRDTVRAVPRGTSPDARAGGRFGHSGPPSRLPSRSRNLREEPRKLVSTTVDDTLIIRLDPSCSPAHSRAHGGAQAGTIGAEPVMAGDVVLNLHAPDYQEYVDGALSQARAMREEKAVASAGARGTSPSVQWVPERQARSAGTRGPPTVLGSAAAEDSVSRHVSLSSQKIHVARVTPLMLRYFRVTGAPVPAEYDKLLQDRPIPDASLGRSDLPGRMRNAKAGLPGYEASLSPGGGTQAALSVVRRTRNDCWLQEAERPGEGGGGGGGARSSGRTSPNTFHLRYEEAKRRSEAEGARQRAAAREEMAKLEVQRQLFQNPRLKGYPSRMAAMARVLVSQGAADRPKAVDDTQAALLQMRRGIDGRMQQLERCEELARQEAAQERRRRERVVRAQDTEAELAGTGPVLEGGRTASRGPALRQVPANALSFSEEAGEGRALLTGSPRWRAPHR